MVRIIGTAWIASTEFRISSEINLNDPVLLEYLIKMSKGIKQQGQKKMLSYSAIKKTGIKCKLDIITVTLLVNLN